MEREPVDLDCPNRKTLGHFYIHAASQHHGKPAIAARQAASRRRAVESAAKK